MREMGVANQRKANDCNRKQTWRVRERGRKISRKSKVRTFRTHQNELVTFRYCVVVIVVVGLHPLSFAAFFFVQTVCSAIDAGSLASTMHANERIGRKNGGQCGTRTHEVAKRTRKTEL